MCPKRRAVEVEVRVERLNLLRHWRLCWEVASDTVVRQQSRDQRPPSWWRHLRWMWRWSRIPLPWARHDVAWAVHVGQPTKQKEAPAGVVRVGPVKERQEWEMHVALLPWARGMGVAPRALHHVANELFLTELRVRMLRAWAVAAYVRRDNMASRTAFEKAGFRIEPHAIGTWPVQVGFLRMVFVGRDF